MRAGRKRKIGTRVASGALSRTREKRGPHAIDTASIYILSADEYSVKIGVSMNPRQRAKDIQVSQDRNICVYWATIMLKPYAYLVETALHKRLRGSVGHLRGEWYLYSPAQAVALVKSEIKAQGFNSIPCPEYGFGDRA